MKASWGTARTSTGSTAVTVADRVAPPRAAISPMRSPGSRTSSSASRPDAVGTLIFTRPSITSTTASPGSRSWKSVVAGPIAAPPAERLQRGELVRGQRVAEGRPSPTAHRADTTVRGV